MSHPAENPEPYSADQSNDVDAFHSETAHNTIDPSQPNELVSIDDTGEIPTVTDETPDPPIASEPVATLVVETPDAVITEPECLIESDDVFERAADPTDPDLSIKSLTDIVEGYEPGAPVILGLHEYQYLQNRRIVIVGGGPVGVWIAWYAALHGARVTIIDDGLNQTFLVAAGWCFPYHSTDPVAVPWALTAAKMWEAHTPFLPTGAVRKERTRVERTGRAAPFPSMYEQLEGYRALRGDELTAGMKSGFEAQSLVIPAQIWHPAMRNSLEQLGVVWLNRHIHTALEFEDLKVAFNADFVVDAMGVYSAFVFDDPKFHPLRGTVLDFELPENYEHGVRSWDLEDGTHRDPYAVPLRSLNILRVGGETHPLSQAKAEDLIDSGCTPEPEVVDAIYRRAVEFMPELKDMTYIEAHTGVRPARDKFLLGFHPEGRSILHASGFGGAGITLAPKIGHEIVWAMIEASQGWAGC
ncbi:hypothetical protein GCM10009795_026380 [Nocardioides hankookensis]|uniref:D-amino-acid oxidase n=1 Tax=Nocardioides hankookensis TaxID=443157 RepID=A0ABW1LD80_9ACTN